MNLRAWGAVAGLAILAGAAARFQAPERPSLPESVVPGAVRPAPRDRPVGSASTSPRNPFEFARPPAGPEPAVATPAPWHPTETLPSPPPDPLRLVGFVRTGASLRAVVAVSGQVVVVGPGEAIGEATVVGVDEDLGVTVRGPGGDTRRLAPATRP